MKREHGAKRIGAILALAMILVFAMTITAFGAKSTLEIVALEQRVNQNAHDNLMSVRHTLHILIHIDSLCLEIAVTETMHNVFVESFNIHIPTCSSRRDAIGKAFQDQMIAQIRQ